MVVGCGPVGVGSHEVYLKVKAKDVREIIDGMSRGKSPGRDD